MLAVIVTYEKNITEYYFATKKQQKYQIDNSLKFKREGVYGKMSRNLNLKFRKGEKEKKVYSWGKHRK